jgi:gliding motility-associated-like protein
MQSIKKNYMILFVLLFIGTNSYSQLVITPTNAVQAVQDVLVGGGVTISNMQYTGNIQALGKFTTGVNATTLGFSEGIIISTGKASQAAGLATGTLVSTDNNTGSDPQLAALVNTTIKDASVLTFKFVPESDTISFRYVFASEEYPLYANSQFNDVFGFFLSGPNPLGGSYNNTNIALIPGTNTPVSINNVNNGNANNGPCMNCAYYQNNQSPPNPYIAYNGQTVVLTATARVIPCLEYTIKLAIGDGVDALWDSGVFLEANSFTSPRITLDAQYETSIIQNSAIEGCSDVKVVFRLPYASPSDRWVEYYFLGSATFGVDYIIDPPNPNYFIIPAGQDSAVLTITPINDGIVEGTENIKLVVLTSLCETTQDTVIIQIFDNNPIELEITNDTLVCESTPIDLWTTATQGIPPYNFQWSNGFNGQNQTITINQTETFFVTVTDACNNITIDSVTITKDTLFLNIMNPATICEGDFVSLTATGSDSIVWLGFDDISPLVSPQEDTYYYATTSNICGSLTDSVQILVDYIPYFSLASDTLICDRDNIELGIESSEYQYLWNTGQNVPRITVNSTGQYILTVTNGLCSHSDTIVIGRAFCDFWIPNAFTPDNNNLNETFRPYGLEPLDYEMLIFDRWGNLIFRTTNFNEGWNGYINGQRAPHGLYYFLIMGRKYLDSEKIILKQESLYLVR